MNVYIMWSKNENKKFYSVLKSFVIENNDIDVIGRYRYRFY